MLDSFCTDWVAWWDTVPTEFAFLLTLPVLVALAGFAEYRIRRRRESASGDPGRPSD